MGTWHVGAHVLDEVVAGSLLCCGWSLGCGDAGGTVSNAEDDVKELDERALGVAAAAVLAVGFCAAAVFVDDAVGESGVGHVL